MRRKRRIGVPIERHAEAIYTRAMHEKFYNELYRAGSYTIERRAGGAEYRLVHFKEVGEPNVRDFIVQYDEPHRISCSCGLYAHLGMLCRHALKVCGCTRPLIGVLCRCSYTILFCVGCHAGVDAPR